MFARTFSRVSLILFAALMALPGASDPITAKMRHEDLRLDRPVTLIAPRIYVGEFLECLSEQSRVALVADEKDSAADDQVMVFLKDIPLGDAMNALWSLMSYKGTAWHWRRSGKPGDFRYQLRRPPAAQQLAAHLRQEVQNAFEAHASTMLAATHMTPEQRRKAVKQMSDSMLQSDGKIAESLLHSDRLWAGLGVFAESLPPEKQLGVLRGQGRVKIPVSQLSAQGQTWVRAVWASDAAQASRKTPDGRWEPIPEPSWIEFEVSRSTDQLAPTLYIHMEGMGGYGYLGATPLHKGFHRKIADLWVLPDDLSDHPTSERTVPLPHSFKPPTVKNRVLEQRLGQMAEAAPLSLMARLPSHQNNDPGPPYNQTVRAFLMRLEEKAPYLHHKWHAGVLLLTYPGWFWDEEKRAPWALVRRLRKTEAAGGGFLSLDDLFTVADVLSKAQLERLTDEFPVMEHVIYWQGLFRLCHRSRQAANSLRSDKGLPLTANVVSVLRSETHLHPYLANGTALAVRLVEEQLKDSDPPSRRFMIGLVTTNQKWIPVMGFDYSARSTK